MEEENIIYYYDEIYLNTCDVVILAPIKLNKKEENIFIEYVDYELRNKKGKVKNNYKYEINLNIHLGKLYETINLYYLLSDRQTLTIGRWIIKDFIFFNNDLLNDFILKINEDENCSEKVLNIINKVLSDLNEVILYHIHNGMNKYNIRNYYIDEKRYNYLFNKLNKK